MTPLPKRRLSTRRQGRRRFTHKVALTSLLFCSNCHAPKIPHIACLACGFYNGRKVLRVKSDKPSKSKS